MAVERVTAIEIDCSCAVLLLVGLESKLCILLLQNESNKVNFCLKQTKKQYKFYYKTNFFEPNFTDHTDDNTKTNTRTTLK